MNEDLFFKNINLFDKLITVFSVIVRDITDEKIVNKRFYLIINVIMHDDNIISLHVKSYVIKNIKTSVILNNDVLANLKNKISLQL